MKNVKMKFSAKMKGKVNGKPLHLTRRFAKMAAVTTLKMKCLIASSSPAESVVEAATSARLGRYELQMTLFCNGAIGVSKQCPKRNGECGIEIARGVCGSCRE